MDAKRLGQTFSNNLQLLRKRKGWSLRRLADLMETSPSVILHWEQGVTSPTLSSITKLCLVFDVGPSVMLGQQTAERLREVPA